MPKNLRSKAALEDALMIARAELIALVMCIDMSISDINAHIDTHIRNVYQYEHLYQKCAEAKCAFEKGLDLHRFTP